jgi:transposase
MTMTRIGPHGLEVAGVRRDGRRRYEPASKERLIEACLRPGVSLAGLALQHGVNANLLRKWVARRCQLQHGEVQPGGGAARLPEPSAFVRVATSPASTVQGAGSPTVRPTETLSLARLQATMPNGVTLSLEGCDPQLLAVMIDALGRCDVPPVS